MRTQYRSHRLYRQPNVTYRGGYSTVGLPAIADPLDLFYGDFSVICSAAGVQFEGILDTVDSEMFGSMSLSTHRLRYEAAGSTVQASADISVGGSLYRVVDIPRRISRSEMVAELVKQP